MTSRSLILVLGLCALLTACGQNYDIVKQGESTATGHEDQITGGTSTNGGGTNGGGNNGGGNNGGGQGPSTPPAQVICGDKKVLICHLPHGNPANAHTICVGEPAAFGPAGHRVPQDGSVGPLGDYLGNCRP